MIVVINKRNLFTMWSEKKGYKNKPRAYYGLFGGREVKDRVTRD